MWWVCAAPPNRAVSDIYLNFFVVGIVTVNGALSDSCEQMGAYAVSDVCIAINSRAIPPVTLTRLQYAKERGRNTVAITDALLPRSYLFGFFAHRAQRYGVICGFAGSPLSVINDIIVSAGACAQGPADGAFLRLERIWGTIMYMSQSPVTTIGARMKLYSYATGRLSGNANAYAAERISLDDTGRLAGGTDRASACGYPAGCNILQPSLSGKDTADAIAHPRYGSPGARHADGTRLRYLEGSFSDAIVNIPQASPMGTGPRAYRADAEPLSGVLRAVLLFLKNCARIIGCGHRAYRKPSFPSAEGRAFDRLNRGVYTATVWITRLIRRYVWEKYNILTVLNDTGHLNEGKKCSIVSRGPAACLLRYGRTNGHASFYSKRTKSSERSCISPAKAGATSQMQADAKRFCQRRAQPPFLYAPGTPVCRSCHGTEHALGVPTKGERGGSCVPRIR